MAITAGYDVGGAHLKVALAEDGRIVAVRQIPCPLWQGFGHLDAALAEAAALIARADLHVVTMTGELCELFPDRATGVRRILVHLSAELDTDLQVYMGQRGFGSTAAALADPASVASMNFLASTELAGTHLPEALLVDMGSTTTDIISIRAGRPAPRGLSDGERLRTGELVYSGLTRTDVSVVVQRGTLEGIVQRLAAGGFANMADVRRVLGVLPSDVDQHATLDDRGKSEAESLERLARCFGRDAAEAPPDAWRSAAREIADHQAADIESAVADVLQAAALPAGAPIIAAGIGAAEVETVAARLGRRAIAFGSLAQATAGCESWATRCAPAVAVALLGAADQDAASAEA